jgi:hypothetical protein
MATVQEGGGAEPSFNMGRDGNGGVVSLWSVPFFGLVEHWILGGRKKKKNWQEI